MWMRVRDDSDVNDRWLLYEWYVDGCGKWLVMWKRMICEWLGEMTHMCMMDDLYVDGMRMSVIWWWLICECEWFVNAWDTWLICEWELTYMWMVCEWVGEMTHMWMRMICEWVWGMTHMWLVDDLCVDGVWMSVKWFICECGWYVHECEGWLIYDW